MDRPAPHDTSLRPADRVAPWLVAVGVGLLVAVLAVDAVDGGRGLAEEQPPILSVRYLARSGVLLLASSLVVFGLRTFAQRLPTRDYEPSVAWMAVAAAGGSVVALGSTLLLWSDPSTLSSLVREDRIVEWLSAGFAFLAGGFFLAAAVRRRWYSVMQSVFLVGLGGVCLLLGLEEISWFQRVLEIESPEFMLNRNGQKELNFHNLATDVSGNVYFMGAFAYGVLLPGLLGDRVLPSAVRWLQPVVPSRLVLYGSAPATALVYQMWNVQWIQLTFWMTLVALVIAALSEENGVIAGLVALVTAITGLGFVTGGDAMVRTWDDTEVRELVIPFGLALAGLEAALRSPWQRRLPSGSGADSAPSRHADRRRRSATLAGRT